jgi:fructose-1-phosphate kinase PfkB-like protein
MTGGGGINVSKAIARLGGTSSAVIVEALRRKDKEILNKELIPFHSIETENWTRESFVVLMTILTPNTVLIFQELQFQMLKRQYH